MFTEETRKIGVATPSTGDVKPYSELARSIVINGVYQHYSGRCYHVRSLARDCDTQRELVIYSQVGKDDVWSRSVTEFCELVEIKGTWCHALR